jgi:hypothetical protein
MCSYVVMIILMLVMTLTRSHTAVLLLLLLQLSNTIHSRNELYEDHDALRNGPGVFHT